MEKLTMKDTKQAIVIQKNIQTLMITKLIGAMVFQSRENQSIIPTARRLLKMYMEKAV